MRVAAAATVTVTGAAATVAVVLAAMTTVLGARVASSLLVMTMT